MEDPELERSANDAYAMLSETVAAVLQGSTAPTLPQPLVTLGVWSLVHGLARLIIDMPGEPPDLPMDDPQARAQAVIDLFIEGLLMKRTMGE